MHVHWVLHSHATMRRITHGTSEPWLHNEITLRGLGMTSRHTRDEPRWGWAPVREPVDACAHEGRAHGADAVAVPESTELPPCLDESLRLLLGESAGTASFTVRPDPESVTAARHFTTTKLAEWGLAALSDDVALVVTELVTNALRHSVPAHPNLSPIDRGTADPAAGSIRLGLFREHPWLLCGILDGSAEGPRRREPDYVAETGRGLHLVESFTDSWGWRGLPAGGQAPGGKIVWALFRLP